MEVGLYPATEYTCFQYAVVFLMDYFVVLTSHFPVDTTRRWHLPFFRDSYLCGVVTRHFSNWYSQNTAPLTLPVAVKVSTSCSTCRVEFGLDGVAALPSA
jgi:hypothetical protein